MTTDIAQGPVDVTVGRAEKPDRPSFAPFKCPVCGSSYFGPIFAGGEHVGRYCKGWPSGLDRSYNPCRGKHEELFDFPNVDFSGSTPLYGGESAGK